MSDIDPIGVSNPNKHEQLTLEAVPGAMELERSSGPSLWRQIAAVLRHQIESETWGKGARLPSESILAEHFNVNRHTVRQAIASLSEQGLLKATRGRGTFVYGDAPLTYALSNRTRFAENVRANKRSLIRNLMDKKTVVGSDALCHTFQLPSQSRFYRLELRLGADGFALMLSTYWIPAERFTHFDDFFMKTLSVTRTLHLFDIDDYTHDSTEVTARLASRRECDLLNLSDPSILMITQTLSYDREKTPLLLTRDRFCAERVHLKVSLGHDDEHDL